jgi:hypothetical protein
MDLASVVETIHKIGGNGADFAVSTFAQYCGHSTANSGPFRSKVAAFRDWGMVTTKDNRVSLTELGKDVARSADPKGDTALLRRAFDSCKLFKDFFDNQAKGIPLKREQLGRVATLDLKVAAKSQEKFVTMLIDSAVAVGLASTNSEAGTVTFGGPEPEMTPPADPKPETHGATDTTAQTPGHARTPAPVHTPERAHVPAAGSGAPVLLRQVWPTATGEVVLAIHSTAPLPGAAFALVGRAVEAADALAKSIGQPEPGEDDGAA